MQLQPITILIQSELDIAHVRTLTRSFAADQGFTVIERAQLATLASYLTRSIFYRAHVCNVVLSVIEDAGVQGIELALHYTYAHPQAVNDIMIQQTVVSGLGTGFPDARQCLDTFEHHYVEETGGIICCRKWRRETG